MKISGFTMVKNAEKYYFPIKESIMSALPIVDEFIVALGKGDDNTRELIESIGSDKVKIFDRVWDEQDFIDGKIFAKETDFAYSQCSGDWCIYLQADELIHEKDFDEILNACRKYQDDKRVDGFLFGYYHFFGDYEHHLPYHGWLKNEIRVIRNSKNFFSYKDAVSFRKDDNQKLSVIELPTARIYHYGWVRPPYLMQSKKKEQDSMHHGRSKAEGFYKLRPDEFDYGPLGRIKLFDKTHPAAMKEMILRHDWKEKLNYGKKPLPNRDLMKHERTKVRIITWLENTLNNGKNFVGYKNWVKLK